MDPDGTIKLVGAILHGTLSLPGAACIGHAELFDEIPGQPNRCRAAELLPNGAPMPLLSASGARINRLIGRSRDLGNEDPDCRINAGQGPLSTRSPVVGKRTRQLREATQ